MKCNQNMRKVYNKFVEKSNYKADPDTHVFVDELYSKRNDDSLEKMMVDVMALRKMVQNSDIFYLPFDKCSLFSYLGEPKDDVEAAAQAFITIEDSPEHNIKSVRKFTGNSFKSSMSGRFILYNGEFDLEPYRDCLYISKSEFANTFGYDLMVVIDDIMVTTKESKVISIRDYPKYLDCPAFNKNTLPVVDHFGIEIIKTLAFFGKFLTDTKSFVVEEIPSVKKKNGIIKSKSKEALYHVMSVGDIRKTIKRTDDSENISNTKVGHERRRHSQGQTIIVEACWVGPTEHFDTTTNKLYKVRLDVG